METMRKIENPRLIIEVNDYGAELCRIYDKKNKREIIWDGNEKYWNRHAPILFPFVGSVHKGQYLLNGIHYPMKSHGFARDVVFELKNMTENSITHVLESTEETYKIYPFHFQLVVTHTITENQVQVDWKVLNKGNNEMLFSIGAHPAFHVPVIENTKQKDYYLEFGDRDELTYIQINDSEGTAIYKNKLELKLENGKYKIGEHLFDKGVLIFEEHQVDEVGISLPTGEKYVTIHAKDFPYVGIWTKKEAPFVCLEPWYGRCDNEDFVGELREKAGVLSLAKNSRFETDYLIEIH